VFGGIDNRYSGQAIVRLARGSLVVLVLFLVGCSEQHMGDLQNYVSDVKARRGKIKPLPKFEPVQQFAYSADDMKDPFMTWKSEVVPVEKHKKGDLMPDAQRPREELESFPLDTLRMMGILEMKGERWGLVKASDGIVYRVRTGNYMGQNFGKITAIEPDRIALVEIVPNGLGGWERREASLTLNTE
jgi:type IV pilus assembly protein PilP